MTRALLAILLAPFLVPALPPAGTRPASSGFLSTAITTQGVRLSLTLPDNAYPKDALVPTTIRLQNLTGRTISTWDCLAYSLTAEVVGADALVKYPPVLPSPGAPWRACPLPPPVVRIAYCARGAQCYYPPPWPHLATLQTAIVSAVTRPAPSDDTEWRMAREDVEVSVPMEDRRIGTQCRYRDEAVGKTPNRFALAATGSVEARRHFVVDQPPQWQEIAAKEQTPELL